MKIDDWGDKGYHWGRGSDDLVVKKGRGQIQLTEGEAYQLVHDLLKQLSKEDRKV